MNKKNIRIILFIWDVVAIVLIFFALIMMFETVIKNLLIDSNVHVFSEVVEDARGEYRNALAFLATKPDLPYAESVAAISSYLKDYSLAGLAHDRSLAMVLSRDPAFPNAIGARAGGETYRPADVDFDHFYFAAAKIPPALTRGELAALEKRLADNDRAFLRFHYKAPDQDHNPVLAVYPNQADALRLAKIIGRDETARPNHVSFSLKGRAYVGVAEFLDVPLGSGLNRASLETSSPVFVVADAGDDFFALINGIRNLFLAILGGIVGVVFFIKAYNTFVITREIKDISGTIRDESKAIEEKGEIGTALKALPLKFRETGSLFDSYSQLSVKLADVGEIISGIADRDLFVATLRNDASLLDPHEVEMAILFLDVQGFTAVSEKHKTEAMSLINRIWSTVEEATGKRRDKIRNALPAGVQSDEERGRIVRAFQEDNGLGFLTGRHPRVLRPGPGAHRDQERHHPQGQPRPDRPGEDRARGAPLGARAKDQGARGGHRQERERPPAHADPDRDPRGRRPDQRLFHQPQRPDGIHHQ